MKTLPAFIKNLYLWNKSEWSSKLAETPFLMAFSGAVNEKTDKILCTFGNIHMGYIRDFKFRISTSRIFRAFLYFQNTINLADPITWKKPYWI